MKAIITAAFMLATFAATAQHEQIHVFRNDGKHFNSFKATEIEKIEHSTADYMVVTATDGYVTNIHMPSIDSVLTRTTGVPEFYVTLNDYPQWTDLLKDATHTKSTVYAATLSMKGNGMFDDLPEQQVEFRGRGNSTWNMEKTPYRFKMEKKVSVCGLPKAKSFALIANYIDCTLMRNAIAFRIAQMLGLPFTNHSIPVHVYFNGIFKGAYMLTEKVGTGSGSVDIDENTGIMFELDTNYDEDFKFTYRWGDSKRLPVMVKDPDLAEIAADKGISADKYFNTWKEDFTRMADAVTQTPVTGSLSSVIDLDQAASYFLVQCITANREMEHPKSLYLHKENLDDVYHFGPVWDFDWAYTFHNGETVVPERPLIEKDGKQSGGSFVKLIFANEEFRQIFKAKLDRFIAEDYPRLRAYMDEYASLIEPSAKQNGLLWPNNRSSSYARVVTSTFNFRQNYTALCDWLDRRISYMQSHPNFGLY